jgi:hypothetical protein
MAENNVWLVPAKHPDGTPKRVADPIAGGILPAEGAYKDLFNFYWERRLRAGDVVRGTPPKPKTETPIPGSSAA